MVPAMALGQVAQESWSVITRMLPAHAVVSAGAYVWAATAGGVLRVDATTRAVTRFTHLDGMTRGAVLCAEVDASGDLWFGTDAGGLVRFSVRAGGFEAPLSSFDGLRVLSLTAHDRVLYVGSDRGVSVLPLDRLRVRESYHQLGRLTWDAEVRDVVVHEGRLWVATEEGVATASLEAANLQHRDSWTSTTLGPLHDLVVTDDGVLAAGEEGVWRYDGAGWIRDAGPAGARVLISTAAGTYVASGGSLHRRQGDGRWRLVRTTGTDILGLASSGGDLWAATQDGVRILGGRALDVSDPPSNQFFDLALHDGGRLWIASVPNDRVGTPRGLFEFDGIDWRVHDRATGAGTNIIVTVEVDPASGDVWVGTWGSGVSVLDAGGRWHGFDENNSALRGIQQPSAPSFVVIPDLAFDGHGQLWATNLQAGLVVFRGFPNPLSIRFEADHLGLGPAPDLGPLAIDEAGLKWIGTRLQGIAMFDDGGTPFDPGDDHAEVIRGLDDPRLTSDTITALAVAAGVLWIGTDDGLHRVVYRYDRGGELRISRWRSYRLEHGLGSTSITCVALDSLGTAWVGTEEGLTQVRDTGDVVHTFTATNSSLADDRVTAVRYDDVSGALWIGTLDGLSRLQLRTHRDEAGGPPRGLVFPNPFDPINGIPLTFTGLPLEADVSLYSTDGSLVATVGGGPGGTAIWNGRVAGGELAASGIYFYVAESRSGRVRGVFAVIHGSGRR